MSKLFEETMIGLMQAVAIEKGDIPVEEVCDMPATTYRMPENDVPVLSPLGDDKRQDD